MQLQLFFGDKVAHLAAPFTHHKRIEQLLGRIFVNDKWLQLFANHSAPDFKIIGNMDKYLVIHVTDKGDEEPGWFPTQFFESLRPHKRDHERDEVIFQSGLVLNVGDILEQPKAPTIDVGRLTEKNVFGRRRTRYYSHTRSILKKAPAKIVKDCIVIDVYLR